jgi:hypothetical protein
MMPSCRYMIKKWYEITDEEGFGDVSERDAEARSIPRKLGLINAAPGRMA